MSKKTFRYLAVWLFSVCTCSAVAFAQDLRHRDYFFGDRAMGLGGAFTALSDDPSAAYYNPAGLPFSEGSMFAGSLIVVDSQTISVADGLRVHPEGQLNRSITSETSGLFPSSGAAISRLGKKHYFTLASFTPQNRSRLWTDRALENINANTHSIRTQTAEIESRRLTGPVYGYRLAKNWGLGLAAMYSRYSYQRTVNRSGFVADELNENATTWSVLGQTGTQYDTRINTGGIALGLSTLWRGDTGWRVGLVTNLPVVTLHSSLDLAYQSIEYSDESLTTTELSGAGAAREPSPMELKVGLAYEGTRFAISLDVVYFHTFRYLDLDLPDGFSAQTGVDPDIPLDSESRSILNAAFGIEYLPSDGWAVRLGVFTNNSSSEDIPEIIANNAYAPQLNEYGFTVGTGYEKKGRGKVHLALGVALGSGHAVVRHARRAGILPQRETLESMRVFVALSGAISFAKDLVKGKKKK